MVSVMFFEMFMVFFFCFFFQAEDGIRDIGVTGVQTCALPISANGVPVDLSPEPDDAWLAGYRHRGRPLPPAARAVLVNAEDRSEERRVGKECRSRWSPYH